MCLRTPSADGQRDSWFDMTWGAKATLTVFQSLVLHTNRCDRTLYASTRTSALCAYVRALAHRICKLLFRWCGTFVGVGDSIRWVEANLSWIVEARNDLARANIYSVSLCVLEPPKALPILRMLTLATSLPRRTNSAPMKSHEVCKRRFICAVLPFGERTTVLQGKDESGDVWSVPVPRSFGHDWQPEGEKRQISEDAERRERVEEAATTHGNNGKASSGERGSGKGWGSTATYMVQQGS